MMKISRLAMPLLTVGLALGAFSMPASASVASLSGNWASVDPNGPIPEILVTPAGGTKVTVEVFGQCEPSNCDWGKAAGSTYSPTVSGNPVNDAVAATAYYQQGFAKRFVILRQSGPNLTYEIFSAFEDNSGRNSYILMGRMHRVMHLMHIMMPTLVKPVSP
jgi:hypothetical protein